MSVEKNLQLTPIFREPINFIGAPRGHFNFLYFYTKSMIQNSKHLNRELIKLN